jgi:hypothetical protein
MEDEGIGRQSPPGRGRGGLSGWAVGDLWFAIYGFAVHRTRFHSACNDNHYHLIGNLPLEYGHDDYFLGEVWLWWLLKGNALFRLQY